MLEKTGKYSWRLGMSTLAVEIHPLAQNVEKSQLENYELLGDGEGIHWPEVDEDLSVAGLLRGDH
jgi:hypothetical protein